MSRILLTGANGFVGKALHKRLLEENHEVFGTVRSSSDSLMSDQQYSLLDVCNRDEVDEVVQRVKPTHLVHLAAISSVANSFKDPLLTWNTNIIGTLNLMESLKKNTPDCFVLFVSSSEVYGESFKTGELLTEEAVCHPMNPYAASKLAAEIAVKQYLRQGQRGVIVRPFNHIGPGQSVNFVTASFARQIALIEAGLQPLVLRVGNLEASRDFLDVNDVCDAYVKILGQSQSTFAHAVYNISSGSTRKIQTVLDELLAQTSHPIEIQTDQERLRPSDIPVAAGSNARIHTDLGWSPATPFSQTLASVLNYWREQTSSSK
ncbi:MULTISPECIES: GDP-mannose 4,6-dehydratase [Pseudomonas syringae group genomosp. 2]|uniref:GDP-6-deoxy-D-lyxo-4-hexulose reductase n=4 Tax=Pseudomonas syringae group genomosp. 2 TaxID=251698 RepID=A0A0N8T117_PSEAJ|nr:GDP-mannose 4,6-dehydratase [Pseudomonas amygdali]AXH57823.1 NAD-dependent epimerase/dehydratase family protein [Pseudomonas amygdali pv. lachrymans str. M301315]KEZ28013.1 GDP-6-deoxy-D-lyxo-4-hexulose reductase [Pseudomonas amygdali pv. tabaci str. 6605]KPB99494.1 GDP-6-deoxy-D-lyxo-4-hexulose reductase [Pseudomonas amygdali pv. lachrymans]KPC20625.1 GDP-6-deoxy-D-lyxo-4-hexulose reductase [Pseudomonas amygdali pv. lachrymans]KPX71795.1 GDP-6-deoxy-D-lyxo-4-hexulose reductase [Pseudomonas